MTTDQIKRVQDLLANTADALNRILDSSSDNTAFQKAQAVSITNKSLPPPDVEPVPTAKTALEMRVERLEKSVAMLKAKSNLRVE